MMTGLRIRPRRLGGEALPRYGLEICFAMPVQGRLI